MQTPASGKSIGKALYWIALAAIFGWAIWRRFALPLEPISDADLWGYLGPALQKLTGGQFSHMQSRNFVYPAFLLSILGVFGDFRAITIFQHVLGLAAGAISILTWRRTTAFLSQSIVPRAIHETLGLFFVGVVVLAGEPIRAEMQLRPEGVCAFVLSLNLYLATEFVARAFVLKEKSDLAAGIGTGLTAFLLASLKPSFILLALVPLLPLGWFFIRPNSLREKVCLGLALVVSALGLFLPEYLLSRDDEFARAFLPTTLFTIHADMIRDQMADDLERQASVPYARERLTRIHDRLAVEIRKSMEDDSPYPSFGFSPDYLMYRESSIATAVAAEFHGDMLAVEDFYRFYYWRTWRNRPGPMARKVARQIGLFYAPVSPVFDRQKYIRLGPFYEKSVDALKFSAQQEAWKKYPPAAAMLGRTAAVIESAPVIEQNKVIRRSVVFLAVADLPLLGMAILMAVAIWIVGENARRLRWFTALTLFVFAYNASACFEVAVLHSFDMPRYATIQFYVTVLAEFLALRLLVEALFAATARTRFRIRGCAS